jgi:hypothetical protein
MKLQKFVFIGLALIFTGSLVFPNVSFACWGTSELNNYECCFKCCSSQGECEAYLNEDFNGCEWNNYCLVNPVYCELSCIQEGAPCPIFLALNNDEKKIDTLRRFRDEVLSKTPMGREYIKLYYEWSPVIVQAMEEDEEFKAWVKETIENLMPMIERAMK